MALHSKGLGPTYNRFVWMFLEIEDAKKASEEAAALKAAEAAETPDYAAGLTSTNPPTPAPKPTVIRETGKYLNQLPVKYCCILEC